MQVVNGMPAVSYINSPDSKTHLRYLEATDASGTTWGPRFTFESVGSTDNISSASMRETSLQVVNGVPAISYTYNSYGIPFNNGSTYSFKIKFIIRAGTLPLN